MSALRKEHGDARELCTLAADDPRHGTSGGYTNHGCRCEACRRANTERHRAWRHGTGFARPRADYLAEISSARTDTLRCFKCRHWLTDDAFARVVRNVARRGRHGWCTSCSTAYRRDLRRRNRERVAA